MTIAERIERASELESRRITSWIPYEECCGMVVSQLTLGRYLTLLEMDNAFVRGGMPLPSDIVQLLWVIQPAFDWSAPDEEYLESVSKMDYSDSVTSISEYIERATFDLGGGGSACNGQTMQVAHWVAYWVHRFAKCYGWAGQQVLDTPLPQLAQLDRIQRLAAGDTTAFNTRLVSLMVQAQAEERAKN